MTTRTFPACALAITLAAAATLPGALAASAAPPAVGAIQLVSVSSVPGTSSTSNEYIANASSVSADGRFVAFGSNAQDVLRPVPRYEFTATDRIYLRDTVLNSTRQISPNGPDGVTAMPSDLPVMTDDGMLVAYRSEGVRVWSAITGLSTEISLNYEIPASPINDDVLSLDIAGSGAALVYETRATDVLPGDPYVVPRSRVYRFDATTGVTTIVESDPVLSASSPSISADGRYVAFLSADDHTTTPTHGIVQAYLRDTALSTTALISSDGTGAVSDQPVTEVTISGDAKSVAFTTTATNLAGGISGGDSHVYVRDLARGITMLESSSAAATFVRTKNPSLSADGRTLVYSGCVDGPRELCQIYRRDRVAGTTRLVSQNLLGESGNAYSFRPSVSATGQYVTWTTDSTNLTADSHRSDGPHLSWHTLLKNLGNVGTVVRAAGADRYETAVATSKAAFADGAATAYIATGETYPDALSGAVAAGKDGGPVLLVPSTGPLPAVVSDELTRLGTTRVVILGGSNSVSSLVEEQLRASVQTVSRIDGADRYAVSAAIAAHSFSHAETVYVASGELAADALVGAAGAGRDSPVLLTQKDALPAAVHDQIAALDPTAIVVLGGVNSVSSAVQRELAMIADTTRVSGVDRYATAAAISQEEFPDRALGGAVYIASGENFPDALAGSAAAIAAGAPVLLVARDSIPASVADELDRLRPTAAFVLGGAETVNDAVLGALESYVVAP
ncbi:cell wall-binding repeat-containing protein [Herbiconiux solani]|uniref:cell wall-binding repeat-containing protein n=1 Tax=Herbiconiux solani TaxID=661329 RepID=UPI00082433A4|nr:cell wall-binding repeat-containing protein [Herbiconiux solani]